jgi:pimeloyl-ACP methyl ester carboxylesterase
MRSNPLLRSAGYCLSAALLLAVAMSGDAFAAPPDHAQGNLPAKTSSKPLLIKEFGSFFVGGKNLPIPYGSGKFVNTQYEGPDVIKIDQMYVQYMIPAAQKHKIPVIFVHGAFHTGKTWETTPDGREGWVHYFLRQGFNTYWVDKPWKGRSAWNLQLVNAVQRGDADPSTLPNPVIVGQKGWTIFRFGPSYGVWNPGAQFPPEGVDEWLKQLVPDFSFYLRGTPLTVSYPALDEAAYALLKRVGPAVYIGHSQGGAEIYTILKAHPDIRFAGVISIEGGPCPDAADAALYKNIPFMYLTGDYRDAPPNCQAFVDAVNGMGGNATSLKLPDIGIHGNDHMMMMDRNSDQVAQVVIDWISANVPGAK